METRIGHRAVLAGASASVIVALAACAPAESEPVTGGATLTEDVLAYDHPEFLTNRPPVLDRFKECDKVTKELVTQLFPQAGFKGVPSQDRKDGKGCSLTLTDAEIKLATSPAPFSDYWLGTVYGEGVPGARDKIHNQGPTHFARKILAGKYHEVEFSTYAGTAQAECHAVIDTGSAQPLVVTSNPYSEDPFATLANMNKGPSVQEMKQNFCPASTNVARKLLATLDPHGGSRAK